MQTPFDTPLELVQSDTTKIFAAPFLISSEISKRAQLFYRVFRKLSYVNLPGFFWRDSHKNPGFFFFKKGADLSAPFPSRSPFSGRTAFLFSKYILFRVWKRAPEEMEVNSEESEQSKFQAKQNQTGIPFPHRPSRPDGEAGLYRLPAVRGVPLSRSWLSLPR